MRRIYLDHAATTPTDPLVIKEMQPYFGEIFGNPSSTHLFGQEAKAACEKAREKIAAFIGANSEEIVFTSGGTEADNLALRGVALANEHKGNHIITTSIEHHGVIEPCRFLEGLGFKVTYLPVDRYGVVDPEDVRKAITDKTILISVMHANNEVGTIEPISKIGEIAKAGGIYMHTDAVQSVGKIPVDVEELKVDLLTLSGHKIYGPKGIGALYVRKGTKLAPLLYGGHHERARRAGTENVPGIVGLGKACEIASKNLLENADHLERLRNRLEVKIKEKVNRLHLNGHPVRRLPHILNISFEFIEGESLILNLDMKGIAASTGSACASGSLEPSHVLIAMGVSREIAQGAVRFSLGRGNTEEETDYTVEVLRETIQRLRSFSP